LSVGVLAEAGEGYSPPGAGDFVLPGIFEGVEWLNKPVLMASVSVIVLICFFYLASRKGALVPGRLQFIGEGAYGFVRKDLGRDILGTDNFMKFIPLIFSLFIFIALNNVFGIVPFIQFPTMSLIGFPIALTLIVWVVYNYVGIQHQGFVGYFKNMCFPPGVPWWVYFILAPLEFVSTLFVRPLTLALRLFANMFAGHLLLLVFILGGEYMLVESTNLLPKILSVGSIAMGIVMTFFELLIQLLQAYIFALLTSLYIAGSLSSEH
jgi:F-type H+-transporting ATPase subunit a